MFDDAFSMALGFDSPRVLPWADLYMKSFLAKQIYATQKASHTVTRTDGIVYLLQILKQSRRYYVPNQTQSARQFEVTVESLARSVSRILDPVQSGIMHRSLFVKSDKSFTEVLYLSNQMAPEKILPEDIGYYSGWREIKPLRMVELSPMSLTLNVDNQMLHYPYSGDGFGVFALDAAALILKYESYRREFAIDGETEDTTMVRYLVDTVIDPCLLPDSFALWCRNLYRSILAGQNPEYTYLDQYWPTEATQIVGAGYPNFLRDVESLKTDLENKNVSARRVLWSLPVSVDNIPLAQWYKDLTPAITLPNQIQYQWVNGLANFSWMELIWLTLRLTGRSAQYSSFIRVLWHPLTQWINNHPWSYIKNPQMQDYIKTRAMSMLAIIQDDLKKT